MDWTSRGCAVSQIGRAVAFITLLLAHSTARADRFEPDDSPAAARITIANDPPEPHTFGTPGDEDWFLFFALPDSPYTIRATSVSATCDVHLTLFKGDGVTTVPGGVVDVYGAGSSETLTTFSIPSDFYYVRLRNADPRVFGVDVSYAIRVEKVLGVIGSARAISTDTVRVEWEVRPPLDFVGWHVFRSTSSDPRNLVRINAAAIAPDQSWYDDTTVKGGLAYYYVVKKEIIPGVLEASAGMFAGIPVDTVDERTVGLRRAAGINPQQAPVLGPGPRCYYPRHRIEFPGYVETAPGTAIDVTIRSVQGYAEREGGGQPFPTRSDALFVVETVQWSGGTATAFHFTDPVNLVLEFMPPAGPIRAGWNDLVTFSDEDGTTPQMHLVRDMLDGPGVDFQFLKISQELDVQERTVTVRNFTNLTGASGQAIYGVVAGSEAETSDQRRWWLYR